MLLSCRYDVVFASEQDDGEVVVECDKADAEGGKQGTSTKDDEDLDFEDDLPVMVRFFAALSIIPLVGLK